ncbi:MAG: biopolymer transporter ExbD [Phycisphaerae bacterium]|nr:biopolymer transporter ExbD [Phycisphaerae bacterium]
MIQPGKIEESVLEEISNNKTAFSNLCLRLAPLIDVIFLLLIFFFISAQFRPAEAILPLEMPAAIAQSKVHIVEPLFVYVFNYGQNCQIQLADKNVDISNQNPGEDFTAFAESFVGTLKDQKRVLADPVVLVFDNEVPWDYVAKIYNLLYGLGINDITFSLNAEEQ